MRTVWTDIADYPTLEQARAGRRRAIARRELLPEPKPIIVKIGASFILEGKLVLRGSWAIGKNANGACREHLIGDPVPPARPVRKFDAKKTKRDN